MGGGSSKLFSIFWSKSWEENDVFEGGLVGEEGH